MGPRPLGRTDPASGPVILGCRRRSLSSRLRGGQPEGSARALHPAAQALGLSVRQTLSTSRLSLGGARVPPRPCRLSPGCRDPACQGLRPATCLISRRSSPADTSIERVVGNEDRFQWTPPLLLQPLFRFANSDSNPTKNSGPEIIHASKCEKYGACPGARVPHRRAPRC